MASVSTPPDSDARLVERVLGGDRHAFAELLRRHDPRLRGVAYKLLAGDQRRLDDVMQEAYLKAYRSLHRFRVDAELRTWLYRIVYNAHRRAAPSATPPTSRGCQRPGARPSDERSRTRTGGRCRRSGSTRPLRSARGPTLHRRAGRRRGLRQPDRCRDPGGGAGNGRVTIVTSSGDDAPHPRRGAAVTAHLPPDPIVAEALRAMRVPDPADGFWACLDEHLAGVTPGDRSDTTTAGGSAPPSVGGISTRLARQLPVQRRPRVEPDSWPSPLWWQQLSPRSGCWAPGVEMYTASTPSVLPPRPSHHR